VPGRFKHFRAVTKQSERLIARAAKKPADSVSSVVVIYVEVPLPRRPGTDGAAAILSCQQLNVSLLVNSKRPTESRIPPSRLTVRRLLVLALVDRVAGFAAVLDAIGARAILSEL
jgi:hypothetical protein